MATQSDVRYSIQVQGDTQFEVVSFTHTEELSELFCTTVKLASFDHNPNFADILDSPVTLTFYRGDEAIRHINGIATQLTQGKSGTRRTHYTLVIEPALSRCKLTADCRHFQQKTVVEIITEVLKENNLQDVSFTEIFMHPVKREFCQQYRETDLVFIQRLAAEEGFYFYFEHSENTHAIKFSNNLQATPLIGEVLYNAKPAGDQPQPCLWQADYQEKLAPTKMAMKDYHFKHPDYRLKHSEEMVNKGSPNEKNVYEVFDSPGRYKHDNAGKPFTKVRLEEHRRDTITIDGAGDDMRLLPGYKINLTGHERKTLNDGWAIIKVTHEGSQTGVLQEEAGHAGDAKGSHYSNDVLMIPWNGQWRAKTRHKPVVDGPQIATVVGPPGEEIYCDDFSRIKLQFEYDRYGKFDEHSSCWIRVSQGWAGTQFGGMAIPRIGQEVIVDFLEGDPDQPIVTGKTYNANNLPPYPLPANKTRMTIKSKTHKGKGFNELRFEDEKDQEEVFIHAQKDQNNVVLNNETTNVGVDRTENIGHDETIHIGNDRTETVGNNEDTTIDGNQTELIKLNKAETIAIAKALSIGAAYQVSVGAAMNQTIGLSKTQQIGINKRVDIGKSLTYNVGKKIHIQAGDEIVLETGAAKITMKSDGSIKLEGSDIKSICDCEFTVNAKNNITFKGKKVTGN